MAEEKSPSFLKALWKRLREPNSVISLSAALISITTFYLVQAKPGKLQVVLPAEGGLRLGERSVELISSMTLTNTGAPRTRKHVVTVLAELRPREQSAVQPLALGWESEWAFIGSLAFHKKYPDQATGERKPDYLDYVSIAAPFAGLLLQADQSRTKNLGKERDAESIRRPTSKTTAPTLKSGEFQFRRNIFGVSNVG